MMEKLTQNVVELVKTEHAIKQHYRDFIKALKEKIKEGLSEAELQDMGTLTFCYEYYKENPEKAKFKILSAKMYDYNKKTQKYDILSEEWSQIELEIIPKEVIPKLDDDNWDLDIKILYRHMYGGNLFTRISEAPEIEEFFEKFDEICKGWIKDIESRLYYLKPVEKKVAMKVKSLLEKLSE